MPVILNKWVEKEKKKRGVETAPSYETDSIDTWTPVNTHTPIKRFTFAARSPFKKTLRGTRK